MIGRKDELAPDVREELDAAAARTSVNTGMQFNIALNYGGRAEIVDAARRLIAAGVRPRSSTRHGFADFLYTAGQPDPDLLIRTSGEMRVSNFLLWQIAYAEIWVTDTLWPDFRAGTCSRRSSPTRSATGATAASKPPRVAIGAVPHLMVVLTRSRPRRGVLRGPLVLAVRRRRGRSWGGRAPSWSSPRSREALGAECLAAAGLARPR